MKFFKSNKKGVLVSVINYAPLFTSVQSWDLSGNDPKLVSTEIQLKPHQLN